MIINSVPRISVILPVYNAEFFIKETIASILKQTFQDFELIIIDDGSTDMTIEYLKSIDDVRVVFARNTTNKGIAYTLNKAISMARCPYIARIDADDICVSTRFEKQINYLDDHPDIDVCGTWIKTVGQKEEIRSSIINSNEIKVESLFNYPLFNPSLMFRRSVFDTAKYKQAYEPAEDYFLFSEIMETRTFHNIPEVLLYYRLHPEQSSTLQCKKRIAGAVAARKNILQKLNPLFDESQIELHMRICEGEEVDLHDGERWLILLVETNKKMCYFNQNDLENRIFLYWVSICFKGGRINLLKIKIFFSSQLFKSSQLTISQLLSFLKQYIIINFNKLKSYGRLN